MRGFAFRASLIIPMANRSELFKREEFFFSRNNFYLGDDSAYKSARYARFMNLTSNWTQKIDFHDGVRSLTVYEVQWWYAAAATIISIISLFSLTLLF